MLDTIKTEEKGPLFIRVIHMGECGPHRSHKHNYEHTTICLSGGINVVCHKETGDENLGDFWQGGCVVIAAQTEHTVTPLRPNTTYICAYAHRDMDEVVIERYVGNPEAYR